MTDSVCFFMSFVLLVFLFVFFGWVVLKSLICNKHCQRINGAMECVCLLNTFAIYLNTQEPACRHKKERILKRKIYRNVILIQDNRIKSDSNKSSSPQVILFRLQAVKDFQCSQLVYHPPPPPSNNNTNFVLKWSVSKTPACPHIS